MSFGRLALVPLQYWVAGLPRPEGRRPRGTTPTRPNETDRLSTSGGSFRPDRRSLKCTGCGPVSLAPRVINLALIRTRHRPQRVGRVDTPLPTGSQPSAKRSVPCSRLPRLVWRSGSRYELSWDRERLTFRPPRPAGRWCEHT